MVSGLVSPRADSRSAVSKAESMRPRMRSASSRAWSDGAYRCACQCVSRVKSANPPPTITTWGHCVLRASPNCTSRDRRFYQRRREETEPAPARILKAAAAMLRKGQPSRMTPICVKGGNRRHAALEVPDQTRQPTLRASGLLLSAPTLFHHSQLVRDLKHARHAVGRDCRQVLVSLAVDDTSQRYALVLHDDVNARRGFPEEPRKR